MEAGRHGMSTSIATDGFCDGESNVNTAIVVFLSSHMKGTLTRANAILQKGLRHNLYRTMRSQTVVIYLHFCILSDDGGECSSLCYFVGTKAEV